MIKLIAIFVMELLAFTFIAFYTAAVEGAEGGHFGRKKLFGLSADMWRFLVVVPLFLSIPLIVGNFDLRLVGTILAGAFIGGILQDFVWFVVNHHFSIRDFNPEKVMWMKWFRLGRFAVPQFYITYAALAVLAWFVFFKLL